MPDSQSQRSCQEDDLHLFLGSLDITLPASDAEIFNQYIVIQLSASAASLLQAKDESAVLLAYRINGFVFPVVLVFLRGSEEIQFCYSTLLLDSYAQGQLTAPLLRKVTADFFSQSLEEMLEMLNPSWANICLFGHLDCPIYWDTIPDMKIVSDLFVEKLGRNCKIPLFPSVFYFNNLYDQNLLEAALGELGECSDILVLGSGAGLEAVCVALKYGVHVDATDINPVAVANTVAACRRTGTDHLVHAWVSDGWSAVQGTYDAILFEAPLATNECHLHDPNRYDKGGRLLRQILLGLPSHLKEGGRMFLMSRANLIPYLPPGLCWKVLRFFSEENNLAIHEIRVE